MTSAIQKTVLPNGLTVVLKEMHHAPVTAFMVWYRVGSRNERPGITGISHWVEHMMFKGTPRFPAAEMDRMIAREGGQWNASTSQDCTRYYEIMPADRIDLAMTLEADRMVNSAMSAEDVESERTVILSERQGHENEPGFLLDEELSAVAFRVHPYHHEIIGDTADLQSMTRDDLYGHYRRHYVPNNAIVVATGDFDSADMLGRIEALFGPIAPGEAAAPVGRTEPRQLGERRVTVEGPGDTSYLTVAYRAPAATDPDYPAYCLLNATFAGGGLGLSSGGGSNRTSRLYKALVTTELAAAAHGYVSATMDPHLYTINAVVREGRDADEVEAALLAELDRLETEPITEQEMARSLKRARAGFIMGGDSIYGQARLIGFAETVAGDYRWYETLLDRLQAVTLDDLERVRRAYWQPRQRIVGRYLPEDESDPGGDELSPADLG